jgi:hypothetical protein
MSAPDTEGASGDFCCTFLAEGIGLRALAPLLRRHTASPASGVRVDSRALPPPHGGRPGRQEFLGSYSSVLSVARSWISRPFSPTGQYTAKPSSRHDARGSRCSSSSLRPSEATDRDQRVGAEPGSFEDALAALQHLHDLLVACGNTDQIECHERRHDEAAPLRCPVEAIATFANSRSSRTGSR